MGERIEYRAEVDYGDMVRRFCEQVDRRIDERVVEQVRERLAELGYRKCSECKEHRGYYLDAETIQRQQEHIAKLTVERDAYFEMVKRVQADCDVRDGLICDMHRVMWACREDDCPHRENGCFRVRGYGDGECWFEQRMRELGIEVRS